MSDEFHVGQTLQTRDSSDYGDAYEWETSTVVRVDANDYRRPILVRSARGPEYWPARDNIRAAGAKRLQYKTGYTWYDVELDPDDDGAEFSANISGTYVRFRYAPNRTPEEIVSKLREARTESGELSDWKLREILNGEF